MRSFAIATLLSAACAVNAANIVINVGQSGLSFSPNNITANVNDVVTFQFDSGPHSATQSNFSQPCVADSVGFDSNPQTPGSSASTPTFNFTVTSTDPIYFHCKVSNHCAQGMVGAINAGSTFAAFQSAAKSGTSPASASGSSGAASASGSAGTAAASSAARQISGGGSALGAAMALLVGLAF